jgi:hypothetical protein
MGTARRIKPEAAHDAEAAEPAKARNKLRDGGGGGRRHRRRRRPPVLEGWPGRWQTDEGGGTNREGRRGGRGSAAGHGRRRQAVWPAVAVGGSQNLEFVSDGGGGGAPFPSSPATAGFSFLFSVPTRKGTLGLSEFRPCPRVPVS